MRSSDFDSLAPIPLPLEVYHVSGTTPSVITRPSSSGLVKKIALVLMADKGNWRIRRGNNKTNTFTAATTDVCTASSHGYETGDGPFQLTTTDTLPAGLATSTNYWIIAIDDDTFKLASSKANATAGTAVDVTDTGTGTHTITGYPLVETPSSSDTSGFGSLYLVQSQSIIIPAVDSITVKGYLVDSAAVLTYWWL